MHDAVLIRGSAHHSTVIVNSKHEGVDRSRGIDHVICALPKHEAMIRTMALVRRIDNRECASDISTLIDSATAGTWKDCSRRTQQLNVAHFRLEETANGRVGAFTTSPVIARPLSSAPCTLVRAVAGMLILWKVPWIRM